MFRARIAAALVALTLGGCATMPSVQSIQTAVQLGTTSIANPVTEERLDKAQNALILVFTGLNAWKRACASGDLPATCRQQIAAVQVYTRKLPPILVRVRSFVRKNDQVNAISAFNSFSELVGIVKTQAASGGVTIRSE